MSDPVYVSEVRIERIAVEQEPTLKDDASEVGL